MLNFQSSHKLPGERKPYDNTIVVLSSSHEARTFLLKDHDIHELPTITSDEFESRDKEKEGFSFISNEDSSYATNVGFKENKRTHDDPLFVKKVVEKLQNIDEEFKSQKIIVYAPAGLNTLFEQEFANKYTDKLVVHTGNYVNTNVSEIFDLLKS